MVTKRDAQIRICIYIETKNSLTSLISLTSFTSLLTLISFQQKKKKKKMSSNAALEEYANDITYAPTPFSIPDKEWPQELKILFKDSIYKDGALKINSFTLSTMICGAFLGAASGIFVDFLVRTLQYKTAPQFRKAHFEFVVVQLLVNVAFLIFLTKYSRNFLPWLELSLAGILFRVLYFLVQGNLAKNMAPFLPREFRPVYA